jgi:hypothetical protein
MLPPYGVRLGLFGRSIERFIHAALDREENHLPAASVLG